MKSFYKISDKFEPYHSCLKVPDTINLVLKKFFTAYNVQGGKIVTALKMYREAAVLQKGVNGNLRREGA